MLHIELELKKIKKMSTPFKYVCLLFQIQSFSDKLNKVPPKTFFAH